MPIVHEKTVRSAEQEELATLEKIFEQCQTAWRKASAALRTIREKKLYKTAGFKTWNDYTLARWGFCDEAADRKIRLGEIANGVRTKNFGNSGDIKESHAAELASFPADMRTEIYETAQQTAPGGKLTAAWIEQTGRRLMDARMAAIKEQEEKDRLAQLEAEAKAKEAEGEEEEEEEEKEAASKEDEASEESEEQPPPPPQRKPPPAPSPSANDRAIRGAASNDITMAEEIKRWEAQAKKVVHKLERLALSLNCTPEDLLERYGS